MSISTDNIKNVLGALDGTLSSLGFKKTSELSADEKEATAIYSGEKGALKFKYENDILSVFSADTEDGLEGAKKLVASLLPENGDEKDVKYVVNELSDSLNTRFGQKAAVNKSGAKKVQQTVSKNAVKNGSSYDQNTLASKLCLVFPELREPYKQNLEEYGEFMGEKFFTEYGTEKVINAIKQNNPQTMKRLFQILNDIYENGTNDTQGLIAVTILGELNNDKILLARCVDYMSETMAPPVIEVNRYLATVAGKRAKKKLLNPPAYKPKKKKKPGFFSQMMAGGGGMTPPIQ